MAQRRAVDEAQRWAADEGRPLTVVPGIGDKNDLLLTKVASWHGGTPIVYFVNCEEDINKRNRTKSACQDALGNGH